MRYSVVYLIGSSLLTLFFSSAQAAITAIKTYDQLLYAVENGNDVKAIIHLDKCTPLHSSISQPVEVEHGSTRFNFNVYSHYKVQVGNQKKDTVATSMTMRIEHPDGSFLIDYGRLRVFEDNSAEFHVAFYDPISNQQKYTMDWSCHISNGDDKNGIMVFSNE